MTAMDAEFDRKAYRTLVGVADRFTRFGNVEAANAESSKVDALVARWPETLRADLLGSLLVDTEQPSVRFRAATGLLGIGRKDLAVPALQTLAKGDGDISDRAVAALKGIQREE